MPHACSSPKKAPSMLTHITASVEQAVEPHTQTHLCELPTSAETYCGLPVAQLGSVVQGCKAPREFGPPHGKCESNCRQDHH